MQAHSTHPQPESPAPSANAEQLPSEAAIGAVVHSFYAKVRGDDLLGPVFEPHLADHWSQHLETMVDFWSTILLSSKRYQGQPLPKHRALGHLPPELWGRWLELFSATVHEETSGTAAEIFVQRAQQIAGHLSRRLGSSVPSLPTVA